MEMEAQARTLRSGVAVEWFSIAWMAVEALVGFGAALGARSIALGAFGADSILEIAAGVILLRRLRAEQAGLDGIAALDRRAARVVGYLLLALAALVALGAARALLTAAEPATSPVGLGLAVASLAVMPWIVATKRRVARRIDSRALAADAACGVACAYMAGTLLIGLALRAALGWLWADPVAALGIVYFVAREGLEAVRGGGEDDCCG